MPDLKINACNTRTSTCNVRFPQKNVNFVRSFFLLFSKLDKKVKNKHDCLAFKEDSKLTYKPKRHCHFKYGMQAGN